MPDGGELQRDAGAPVDDEYKIAQLPLLLFSQAQPDLRDFELIAKRPVIPLLSAFRQLWFRYQSPLWVRLSITLRDLSSSP